MTDETRDELDRVLDAALAKYAAVEPRTGLEDRVLANLRAEQVQVAGRAWWNWRWAGVVLAGAAMATSVVAWTLGWRWQQPSAPGTPAIIASQPAVTTKSPSASGAEFANRDGSEALPRAHEQIRTVRGRTRHSATVAVAPKLDVFPSPQPLSEEELALVRYASQFPQDAALIATAQQDYEREIQQKMNEAQPESELTNSN